MARSAGSATVRQPGAEVPRCVPQPTHTWVERGGPDVDLLAARRARRGAGPPGQHARQRQSLRVVPKHQRAACRQHGRGGLNESMRRMSKRARQHRCGRPPPPGTPARACLTRVASARARVLHLQGAAERGWRGVPLARRLGLAPLVPDAAAGGGVEGVGVEPARHGSKVDTLGAAGSEEGREGGAAATWRGVQVGQHSVGDRSATPAFMRRPCRTCTRPPTLEGPR